jgi:hypothetical protein
MPAHGLDRPPGHLVPHRRRLVVLRQINGHVRLVRIPRLQIDASFMQFNLHFKVQSDIVNQESREDHDRPVYVVRTLKHDHFHSVPSSLTSLVGATPQ